jgi:hypothetical protein
MKPLDQLTKSEIESLEARQHEPMTENTRAFCLAGFGHFTGTVIRLIAALPEEEAVRRLCLPEAASLMNGEGGQLLRLRAAAALLDPSTDWLPKSTATEARRQTVATEQRAILAHRLCREYVRLNDAWQLTRDELTRRETYHGDHHRIIPR